jgi:hypothetical protein
MRRLYQAVAPSRSRKYSRREVGTRGKATMAIAEKTGRPPGLPKTGGRTKGTPNRATAALKEKLAALGCDPVEELVRIARDSKTADGAKVLIYSTLMPYVYPKRKVIDDSNEERATVNVETMTPEDALDLARDLISVFGPRAAAQKELSAPVIEGEPNPTVEEPGHEN